MGVVIGFCVVFFFAVFMKISHGSVKVVIQPISIPEQCNWIETAKMEYAILEKE